MFIRRKIVNGRTYYSVVENRRANDGRVKQRVIVSLGDCSTVEAALARQRDRLAVSIYNGWKGREDGNERERCKKQIQKLEHALAVVSKHA